MSDTNTGGNGGSGGNGGGEPAAPAGGKPQAQAPAQPAINVLGQYIKDLSFENPRAPQSFGGEGAKSPPLNVSVNVAARPVGENIEVDLKIEARAGAEEEVLFNVELVYSGLFSVKNVQTNQLQPFILIEGPRLLFPFARQIVAETISSGGFPPLMLDPIDFVALYRQRVAQAQQGQQNPTQA